MAMAVSSSSSEKYDVFISFSGEDVRYTFLSHLISALKRKQNINAFTDEEIPRGDEISAALINTINNSYIYIVIFSKNYPYSSWCLDELAQILHCHKTMDKKILPVFYSVDPSHVQNLEGDFNDAFAQHRKRSSHRLEKVETWSRALKEISLMAGFVSSIIMPESKLIDEIVDAVSTKIKSLHPNDYSQIDGLFGIASRVSKVESLLRIELSDHVRLVGIWGMGGIGKTTIADKVYNKIKHNFDAHYFVANVRETLEKRTLKDLRDQIFCQLLGEKNSDIGTLHSLETSVKRRLKCKKVLIVLDDMNDSKQLRLLLGDNTDLFCHGSRIIVTSRDCKVLKIVGREVYIYAVDGLNDSEALKLFSWHAFRQKHPKQEYMNLSKRAIRYAQGNSLALVVLGSNLYDRGIEEWEDELEKVKSISDMDIQKILRISYDGLDRDEQKIFLDIACFFKGMDEDILKRMLQNFGFYAEIGIKRLFEKSLITKVTQKYSLRHDGFYITMHDLVEQMGREIVVQECNRMVGEQSRLWNYDDIIHVLKNNLGTAKVEGILLDIRWNREEVEISCKAFEQMHNLRFLQIVTDSSKLLFGNGCSLGILPDKLRYLKWEYYPFKYLPSNFCPHSLVELRMPYSQLKELGNLNKSLKSLKRVDLSGSRDLISVDFSNAGNLCFLKLDECSSLEEICWSVKAESECTILDLRSCKSLCRLLEIPHNIENLYLHEDTIEQLPAKIGSVKGHHSLDLKECSILVTLPDSVCDLKSLKDLQSLNLKRCSRLVTLLDSICDLKSLKRFDVSECVNLYQLPEKFGNLQNLREFNAAGGGIRVLPDSLCYLTSLEVLDVSKCVNLYQLPNKFGNLQNLRRLNAANSGIQELPESINQLHKLENLNCSGCEGLKLPLLIGLPNLHRIYLSGCHLLEFPKGLYHVTSLAWIDLSGNNFKSIPASINKLPELQYLFLKDCKRLEVLPELPSALKILEASNCTCLESVSTAVLPARDLILADCINLKQEESTRIADHVLKAHLSNDKRKCRLYIAGSEMPDSMMYKNESGSSLSIILDPNDRLIGFSLCAVLASSARPLSIKCSAILTDMSGHVHQNDYYHGIWFYRNPQSGNLLLWYGDASHDIGRICKATFRFYGEVLKCGIHPIFEELQDQVDSMKKKKKRRLLINGI